ncbi:MAG: hypothetical protein BWY31_02826 [Lentisphaerae bacterium ADurb.Bin242]|nr:MAG: hypothetical protein BWY31_02826 [Lentisphaerae bacterium ADurb.Bin242]
MNRNLLSGLLALAALFPAAGQENPVYKLFPSDIRFHLSFNDGTCSAEMAGGKAEPTRLLGTPVYDKGLFGKCLAAGQAVFDAKDNLDLSMPGTVILWVAPANWPSEKPADGKEPGFGAFYAHGSGKGYGYDFIVGKMGGQPWGAGHMNTYVQYQPSAIKHVNCVMYDRGRVSGWKNGEWRMLASTWKPGTFTNSVNGSKSAVSTLKVLMSSPTQLFRIGTSGKEGTWRIRVDELVILNRALTDEELKKLYDETLKAVAEPK